MLVTKGKVHGGKEDIYLSDRKGKGEFRNERKCQTRKRKYHIERKGLKVVKDELKQRLVAWKSNMVRYD